MLLDVYQSCARFGISAHGSSKPFPKIHLGEEVTVESIAVGTEKYVVSVLSM